MFSACVLAGMQCVPHARLLRLNQGVRGSSRRHLSCTKPPPTSPFAHESTQHSTLTNPLRSTSRLFSPFLFAPALDCRLGGTTSEQRNDAHALACSNRVLSLANPAHCNSPTPDGLTCGFCFFAEREPFAKLQTKSKQKREMVKSISKPRRLLRW